MRGPVDFAALRRLEASRAGVSLGDLRKDMTRPAIQCPSTIYHDDTIVKSKNNNKSLQEAGGRAPRGWRRLAQERATGVPPVTRHGRDGHGTPQGRATGILPAKGIAIDRT